MNWMMEAEPAGLYVHIPFCIKKCPYCDFYSITDTSFKPAFIGALMQEISMVCKVPFLFDTLYFGGGTPSVFEPRDIGQIIKTVHKSFNILPGAEITIEVNPGTVKHEKLKSYRSSGVNRINIGVQSFQDTHLNFLGRIHSGKDAEFCIKAAQNAGFENIGLDLIYGIPGQRKQSWLFDLQRAVEFEPEHLSCYMLTYESGTPMDRDRQKGLFRPQDDHLVTDLFETTVEFLNTHGYVQYEISNFARSISKRSRHNQKYWSSVPYIGLGPSAHSFIEPERSWNHRSVIKYIKDLDTGRRPLEEKEVLTKEQQMIEAVYLGLRRTDGIHIDDFDKKFHVSFTKIFGKVIKDLEEKKLIKIYQNHCKLTCKGMLFLDSITGMLIRKC